MPGYVEECATLYAAAQADDARCRARCSTPNQNPTLAEAARASGDLLFGSDVLAAMAAYRGLTTRPTKLPRAMLEAIWGSDAERLADYAKAFARNTGISLRYAVADAIVQAAMRGNFLRAKGHVPISFQAAMTNVYAAARADDRHLIGDTGGSLHVKPAIEGAMVRRPECNMRPLNPSGEVVPDNLYWRRRLQHGDVVLVP